MPNDTPAPGSASTMRSPIGKASSCKVKVLRGSKGHAAPMRVQMAVLPLPRSLTL
jgi:hypothetical protein